MARTKVKAGTAKREAEERRKRFVDAYITNGGNVTKAAEAAGFSARTAASQGSRLLKDVKVLASIKARQAELAEKHALEADDVIREVAGIVHADLRQLFRADGTLKLPHEWPDSVAGAVAAVEVVESGGEAAIITKKVKLWDKNSAIEKAMKHLGLFKEDNAQRGQSLVDFLQGLPKPE